MNRASGRKTSSKNPRTSRSKRRRETRTKTLSKTRTRRKLAGREFFRFHEVKGKRVQFVELYMGSDFRIIDVCFEDKTALAFTIDPGITVKPDYSDWRTGTSASSGDGRPSTASDPKPEKPYR
jgi:hypothetical protein